MLSSLREKVNRWQQLVNKLTICDISESDQSFIKPLQEGKGSVILSFLNANAANISWENKDFFEWFIHSDIIIRDGSGILTLLSILGRPPGKNLNGTDFIPLLLNTLSSKSKKKHIAVYGTREPYLSNSVEYIKKTGFETVEIADGFQSDEYYVDQYLNNKPSVIILGMGMPKQNRVAIAIKDVAAGRDVLIINGGAIVDFMAGRYERAPEWIRKYGIEWIFRFIKEPKRLWGRIVYGKPLFIWRTLLVRLLTTKSSSQ